MTPRAYNLSTSAAAKAVQLKLPKLPPPGKTNAGPPGVPKVAAVVLRGFGLTDTDIASVWSTHAARQSK